MQFDLVTSSFLNPQVGVEGFEIWQSLRVKYSSMKGEHIGLVGIWVWRGGRDQMVKE
jgi:hypothetical protein